MINSVVKCILFKASPLLNVLLPLFKWCNYCGVSSISSLVLVPVGWGFLVVSEYGSRAEKVNIHV